MSRSVRRRWFEWRLSRVPLEGDREMVHLGSDWGGWYVPDGLIEADWVCYSVGAGSDVSFDLETAIAPKDGRLKMYRDVRPDSGTLSAANLLGGRESIGHGTLRKMRQNLGWAIGYNTIALPIGAGVFEPSLELVLRPEIAALSMAGSSLIVAVNALMLKRLQLPRAPADKGPPPTQCAGQPLPEPATRAP